MTSQMVPRTVAELFRPVVRKRPFALPRRRRIARRLSAALAPAPAVPRCLQRLKLPPLSRRSVSPLAARLRDWSTWNTPFEKRPSWIWSSRRVLAEVSRAVPPARVDEGANRQLARLLQRRERTARLARLRSGRTSPDPHPSAHALQHGPDAEARCQHPIVERVARLVGAQVGGGGRERRRAASARIEDSRPARILDEPAERVGRVDIDGLASRDDEDLLAVRLLHVDGGVGLVHQDVLHVVALLDAVRPPAPVLERGPALGERQRGGRERLSAVTGVVV